MRGLEAAARRNHQRGMRRKTILVLAMAMAVTALAPLAAQTRRPPPAEPIDLGPDTPEVNAAHRGGGVILEGLPGEPAPAPRPTPAEGPNAPLVVREAPPSPVPVLR